MPTESENKSLATVETSVDGRGKGAETTANDHNCLRERLLSSTIRRAWEGSPFYRDLYDRAGVDPKSILTMPDLQRLPMVNKRTIREAGRDARCFPDTTRVSHIQHTSGTTGKPLFVYRSADEARFIRDFFSQLSREIKDEQQTLDLPLTLVLSGMDWHGTPTIIPGNAFPIHCSLLSESYFAVAVDLLRRQFDLPGVTPRVRNLTASNELLTFTSWCLERGIRCREEFAINAIQLTGFYLTSRWRKLLAETWGAVVLDRYTMAEHFGGATRIDADGFRFDPHVAYELVGFDGRKQERPGPGMLLLTSLHPFVQLQPLIRYWTGDIFRWHASSRADAPALEFLGRESQALFHPDDPTLLLLSGVDAIEALDGYPEVARTPNFREGSDLGFNGADGYPIFNGSHQRAGGKFVFKLKVGVLASPYVFGPYGRNLQDSMRAEVLQRSEPLRALVEEGDADLVVEHVPAAQLQIAFGTEQERLEVAPRLWNPA